MPNSTQADNGAWRVSLDLRPRTVVLATLTATAIGVGFLFLYRIYMIIFLFFVAFSVATALKPIAAWCRKNKVPVAVGIFGVYGLGLLIIGGFLWFIGPVIFAQVQMLLTDLPEYYRSLRTYLTDSPSRLMQGLASLLPTRPSMPVQTISDAATTGTDDSVSVLEQMITETGRISFLAIAVFLLAYYWLLEGEATIRRILMRLPLEKRDEYRDMIVEIEDKIGAYFRGQLLLCLIIGLFSLVAFWIIGVPNAITLAIISGVTEAIPMIGPLIGAVPAILTTLTTAPDKALWVVLAIIIIQQAENNFLVPKIMDRSVGVHPLMTIFAIAAFGLLFGVVGAILAIPLAAILQILGRYFLFNLLFIEREATNSDVTETTHRNRFSVLRLAAEELIEDVRKQARKHEDSEVDDSNTEKAEDQIEAVAENLQMYLLKKERQA